MHAYIHTNSPCMNAYMSTCRHPYMHTYIYIHTHTYRHIRTYTYIYVHIRTHSLIYVHILTYTHIYAHIRTYTYIYVHIRTYTYIYSHILTYIHIYAHIRTYTDILVSHTRTVLWEMCSWNFDFDSFLPGEDTDQNWAAWAAPLILLASMVVSCRDGLSLWTLQLGTESGLILQIFQLYQQIPMGFKIVFKMF